MTNAKATLARYEGKFEDDILAKAIREGRVDEAVLRAAELTRQHPDSVGYGRIIGAQSGTESPLTSEEKDVIAVGAFLGVMRLCMLESGLNSQ